MNEQTTHLDNLRVKLAKWFELNARQLPWRETSDPYHIWLSEVILQQTQVVQGLDYYHRFIERYPTINSLASAQEDDVLRLWQGLGYYSRGRNLLKAAQMMAKEFGGEMPRSLQEVKKLPGVGPYTQAAILSFAYNLPYATVDGNVYRVLSRLDACAIPIDSSQGQKHFQQRANELLDHTAPGRHNQALIELGALVCKPRNPLCHNCPIASYCLAYAQGTPHSYPVKQGKIKLTHRYLHYFWIELDRQEVFIHRRGRGDIWEGLYELPLIETPQEASLEELLQTQAWEALIQNFPRYTLTTHLLSSREHRLTHQVLHAKLYHIQAQGIAGATNQHLRIPISALSNYGMPALLVKMLQEASDRLEL